MKHTGPAVVVGQKTLGVKKHDFSEGQRSDIQESLGQCSFRDVASQRRQSLLVEF